MNKSVLKAVFINAKAAGAKYIGVKREVRTVRAGNHHKPTGEFR